jgi:hypothetical protein
MGIDFRAPVVEGDLVAGGAYKLLDHPGQEDQTTMGTVHHIHYPTSLLQPQGHTQVSRQSVFSMYWAHQGHFIL